MGHRVITSCVIAHWPLLIIDNNFVSLSREGGCVTNGIMLPYQTLYVYEIPGVAVGSRNVFKDDFLGCWTEGEISFLFFSSPHDEEVEAFADKNGWELRSRNVLDYKEWQAGEELKPFKIDRLVISPPWEPCAVEKGEHLILLDPCVVFGTGSHPTTRACLHALCEIYRGEEPRTVLDLGTGTGILALAAAKLGAERVLAVDCNELAVETALRNVSLNRESHRVEVRQGWAEQCIEEEAEVLCANLHGQVIEALLTREAFFRKRWFILSGIFVKDALEIERKLNQASIETVQAFEEKVWRTWVCVMRH